MSLTASVGHSCLWLHPPGASTSSVVAHFFLNTTVPFLGGLGLGPDNTHNYGPSMAYKGTLASEVPSQTLIGPTAKASRGKTSKARMTGVEPKEHDLVVELAAVLPVPITCPCSCLIPGPWLTVVSQKPCKEAEGTSNTEDITQHRHTSLQDTTQ